jgi:hypothetical protein
MATRKPLVIGANGKIQQLQSGDTITSPNAGTDLLSQTNNQGATINIGQLVYSFTTANNVKLAQANAAGTADVLGMVFDVTIASAASGNIATGGLVTATTTQWDAVTGQTGGLTPGSSYYLDAATAGKMTTTAPTTAGQLNVLVGTALSTTDFLLDVQEEILL